MTTRNTQSKQVLFVDDDEASTTALIRSLERQDSSLDFQYCSNLEQGLEFAAKSKPQVVVLDLCLDQKLGPEIGLDAIATFLKLDPSLRILVLTGHTADSFGVKALQQGAASFLAKPVDTAHLLALLNDAFSYSELKRKYLALAADSKRLEKITGLRSANKKMLEVIEAVAFAATNNQPVLIVGETGTGKGVIARSIHNASRAATGAFIRYQGAFTGQDLVSSELFGHKKGAFTGATEDRRGLIEAANKGSLFIDEIDELPPETQILLLNVLQEKTFRPLGSSKEIFSDFRLLAATNRNIENVLKSNRLRADLYHRIAHLTIEIPPLRERKEDISQLAEHFLQNLIDKHNLPIVGVSREAIAKLNSHLWPGNVRELQAVVEGGAYLANYRSHSFIEVDDINLRIGASQYSGTSMILRERVRLLEQQLAEEAMSACDNNQTKAAEHLGLDRSSFRRILSRINEQ